VGTWGVALFSDDLAADLREEFLDLIGEGLTASEATAQLQQEYPEEAGETVFWLALAATQWKLGRVDEATRNHAVAIIDGGRDLEPWEDDPSSRRKREVVLKKLRNELLSDPPPPKRVPRRIKAANEWSVGELIALRLASGLWTVFRVIGHHVDNGGRFAVCEPLDWVGEAFPTPDVVSGRRVRSLLDPQTSPLTGIQESQFLFGEPRTKNEKQRVVRMNATSPVSQAPGGYSGLVWPLVDRILKDRYGLE